MRTEKEMLNLILKFARADEDIRAVIMNGSRVNPKVHRDILQDYDIMFVVSDMDKFVRDRSWIHSFGELIIMQTPDENTVVPSDRACFAFLMLFQDGNRVDLTLYPLERWSEYRPDSLSKLLLDKDNILGGLPQPTENDYLPPPPSSLDFASCCNEFLWVSTYVAKGLWRRQLPYAKYMLEAPVREMLTLMLTWYIGIDTNFGENVGMRGKYFERLLPPDVWTAYVHTYSDENYPNIWRALFAMHDLFKEIAHAVAGHFGFAYPTQDDERVIAYVERLRDLPHDAETIF